VAAFVQYGSLREPGLLLLSSTGELRFWGSISVGLSGAEGFFTAQLTLQLGESVVALNRVEVSIDCFIAVNCGLT
jgi:nuclear pore complex protein Nup133